MYFANRLSVTFFRFLRASFGQGVRVAVIFEDLDDGRIRVSLRSKDPAVSVAAIAAQFGGGGHAMASGIRMRGELADCRERVLNAIRKELQA